ncbi:MAG: hypothetical protein IIX54_04960 [Clostridia bacterium]|nr:hypothetical protein [Clostridia bacterium]
MKTNLHTNTENTWNLYTDTQKVDGEKLEYEIIFGNENIVFIKAGAGGDARGYENKYIKMAQRVHERIGATVICASNPFVEHEKIDEQKIRWVVSELGFEKFNLYLLGTSDGAYQNIHLAKRFPETVKWIGVNSSFISIEGFEEHLSELSSVQKILVYGTEDDDYDIVFPALTEKEYKNQKIYLIKGADHRFTNMLPQFIQTIDLIYQEGMDEPTKDEK